MELIPQLERLTPGMRLFLNIDGVVQNSIGLSATGGVLRDEARQWLLSYNQHLWKCS
ncbi:hypothetical protein Golob_010935, partial [Gossypium lobatum]|nr:hypothetical protein [Gossypium lobatum]